MRLTLCSLSYLFVAIVGCSAPQNPVTRPAPAEAPAPPSIERDDVEPATLSVPKPPPKTCAAVAVEPFAVEQTNQDPPLVPIANGDRLAHFYAKVAALLRGEAQHSIRIAVYGDSNLIQDFQTGQMRRRLQARFGDAGHGIVSVGRPWWAYVHMDVKHGSKGWTTYAVSTDPAPDRLYGLTGISADSFGTRSAAWVETARKDAPVGVTADTFDIFYHPYDKASFEVRVDGRSLGIVEAAGQGPLGVHHVEVDDTPHRLEVLPRGSLRLFGISLERRAAKPSFVVDSFGVGALNSRSQAMKDPALEEAMLRARDYDLVVFHTGHNDGFTHAETPRALASIIAMHRRALPNAPILMLTPADRGKTDTMYFTRIAVEQRREIAADNQTALWDLFEAMGGRRSMGRFKARGLAASDYVHFNQPGGAWVGDRLLHALWEDLARYLTAHPDAGCGDEPPSTAGAPTLGTGTSG